MKRLWSLEEENAKLTIVADLSLDSHTPGRAVKKALRPACKRKLVDTIKP